MQCFLKKLRSTSTALTWKLQQIDAHKTMDNHSDHIVGKGTCNTEITNTIPICFLHPKTRPIGVAPSQKTHMINKTYLMILNINHFSN
jgi:hypothetical protein